MEIRKIAENDRQELKRLRLYALKNEPLAFGSSFEESAKLSDEDWKKRATPSNVFTYWVFVDWTMQWMAWRSFSLKNKVKHVAKIWWVFIDPSLRWKWVGSKLINRIVDDITN